MSRSRSSAVLSLVRLSGVLLDSWSSPLIIGGGAVLMLADVEKWVVCGGVRLQGGKCRGLNREVESEEWEIAVESRETQRWTVVMCCVCICSNPSLPSYCWFTLVARGEKGEDADRGIPVLYYRKPRPSPKYLHPGYSCSPHVVCVLSRLFVRDTVD